MADVHREYARFLGETSADSHSFAHLREYIRKIGESWVENRQTLEDKQAVEAKRAQAQLQQLIRMKMDELITDEEFRAQRLILEKRSATLDGGTCETDVKPQSVLDDLDAISAPLMHLADAWLAVPISFQRRFQHITLPAGYVFGRVGTADKSRLLSFLQSPLPVDTNEVPPTGESWNQLAEEIRGFAMIFRDPSKR